MSLQKEAIAKRIDLIRLQVNNPFYLQNRELKKSLIKGFLFSYCFFNCQLCYQFVNFVSAVVILGGDQDFIVEDAAEHEQAAEFCGLSP